MTKLIALAIAGLLTPLATAGTLYGLSSSNPAVVYRVEGPGLPVATPVVTIPGATTVGAGLEAFNGTLYATNVYNYTALYGSFGSIDLQTGDFTPIIAQDQYWNGLAVDPATGFFYTTRYRPNDSVVELLRFTTAGAVVVVGELEHNLLGLAFNTANGLLYGVSMATLYTVDPQTATMGFVGGHTASYSTDAWVAYIPENGLMYLSVGTTLYVMFPQTGATVASGGYTSPTPLPIGALAYMEDFAAVPEPATFLATGLALLALGQRRRASLR